MSLNSGMTGLHAMRNAFEDGEFIPEREILLQRIVARKVRSFS